MVVFYTDVFEVPLPDGHKFPMHKYRLLREYALEHGILYEHELYVPELASREQLALVHDPAYIDDFCSGAVDARMVRRIGLPWSDAFVRRSLASTGATVGAARAAMLYGFGGNLAGGTHHASTAAGEGFCVFNDIAVAIGVLMNERLIQRAAVIDLDVHQGNGTAEIFRSVPQVYTLSLHGANNYPFIKVPSTRDVALPDNCGDDEYLEVLRCELAALREFAPDIVFYQGGVDVLAEDALGRLALTTAGVVARDTAVVEFVQSLGVPLVATLGGGYARPITATVQAHAATYRVFRKFYS